MIELEHDHWSSPSGCHPDCPACSEDVQCECDNCAHRCQKSELNPIKDYHERVDTDGDEPDGECPNCGALSYEVVKPTAFEPDKRKDGAGLTNGERAARAAVALAAYVAAYDDPPDEAHFADLLCDLQHLAHRDGLSFEVQYERARMHFNTGSH